MRIPLPIIALSFALISTSFATTGTVSINGATERGRPVGAAQASATSASVAAKAASSSAAAKVLYQNTAGISSGNSNISQPDPCGPPIQDPGPMDSASTCHLNVSVSDLTKPQAYGVQCLHDNTPYILDGNTCADSMATICYTLSGMYGPPPTNQWVWSSETGNCTFGFWLPANGAPPPSYDRCSKQIIAAIAQACTPPYFNVGAVNLKELPSATVNATTGALMGGSGLPVDGGYPSYIMVAQAGPGGWTP